MANSLFQSHPVSHPFRQSALQRGVVKRDRVRYSESLKYCRRAAATRVRVVRYGCVNMYPCPTPRRNLLALIVSVWFKAGEEVQIKPTLTRLNAVLFQLITISLHAAPRATPNKPQCSIASTGDRPIGCALSDHSV